MMSIEITDMHTEIANVLDPAHRDILRCAVEGRPVPVPDSEERKFLAVNGLITLFDATEGYASTVHITDFGRAVFLALGDSGETDTVSDDDAPAAPPAEILNIIGSNPSPADLSELDDAYQQQAELERQIIELRKHNAALTQERTNLRDELATTQSALQAADKLRAEARREATSATEALSKLSTKLVDLETERDYARSLSSKLQAAQQKLIDGHYFVVTTVTSSEAPDFLALLAGQGYKIDLLQFMPATSGDPTLSVVAHRQHPPQIQPDKPAARATAPVREPYAPRPSAHMDSDDADLVELSVEGVSTSGGGAGVYIGHDDDNAQHDDPQPTRHGSPSLNRHDRRATHAGSQTVAIGAVMARMAASTQPTAP